MTFTACMPFEQLTLFVREDGSVDIIVSDDHYNTTIPVVDALVLANAIRLAAGYEHVTVELACASCAAEPEET
jgi:hypothetical protein